MTHSFLSLQTLPISLRKWRKPALTVLTLPLLISPALPAYAQDYTSGLVGYWAFDETSGTTAIDNSSNSIDGTLYNIVLPTQSVAGIKDTAYNFIEGSGNRVELGDNYDLDGSPFTLSLWINVHTINSNYEGLIDKFGSAEGYRIFFDTNGRLNFDIRDSSGTVEGFPTPTGTITTGSWIHIAVSFDNATTGRIYINGTEVASKTNFSITRAVGTRTLLIGRSYNFGWFDGAMDEVRIYNRVLTPSDVTALYESAFPCKVPFGFTGEIIFNDDDKIIQYCNGTEWVATGKPSSSSDGLVGHWKLDETNGTVVSDSTGSANGTLYNGLNASTDSVSGIQGTALHFDGSDDYMGTSYTPGTVGTISAWFKPDITMNSSTPDSAIVSANGGGQRNTIFRKDWGKGGAGTSECDGDNGSIDFVITPTNGNYSTVCTQTTVWNADEWYMLTATWDGSLQKIYVNGVLENAVAQTQSGGWGGLRLSPSGTFDGTIDDLRAYNRVLDDTEIALIYDIRQSSCNEPTHGLVGHWAMDETTGTAVSDSSGNGNNGTWSGETAVVSTSGKVGTAFSLDGADDMITVPHSASLDISSGYTVSGWVYFDSTQAGTITPALISKNDGGGWGSGWVMGRASGGGNIVGGKVRMVTQHNRNISSPSSKASGWIYPVDTWNYVTVSWDGNTIKYYLDGTLIESGIISVPPDTSSGDLWIGHGRSNWYSVYHQGSIDEMRLYNYALSDTEVASLYGASGGTCNVETCSSPFGFKGGLIFNTTHNVMQYCNGKNWTAMGPAGNGGGGCSNPTGVQAELMYNSDLNVLQYCEGDEWIGITPKMDSLLSSGLIGHWKLDETSGATIADSSGNGNNAIWTDNSDNNVTGETTVGAVGNAIIFDGTETVASVGSAAEINNLFNGGGTIATWFKANGVGENNYGRILEKATGTGASNGWSLTLMNGPNVRFWREFSGGDGQWGNIGITYGKWHHIAVTYDDSDPNNDPIIYLDGSIIATSDSNSTGTAIDDSAANFTIGNSNAGDRTFDGAIDDTRIYNRALSAAEITEVYNLGTPPIDITSNLIGHWKLDETSGTTASDSIGSNNGTMTNMDGASNTVAGPVSSALSFSSSRITAAAASTDLDDIFNGGGTISYWIYPTNWGTFGRVVDKSDSGTFPPNQGWHSQGSTGIIKFSHAFSTTHGDWETGTNTVPMSTWSHIVITYDNSSDANAPTIYVNGVNSALTTVSTPSGTAVSDASQPITLGARQGGANNYTGYADDIRMYNRVLTASEVTSLYNLGTP